jgi:trehalose-phosphatase
MRLLFAHWSQAAQRIAEAKHRLLLFDFDGTLVPIRSHPKDVRLAGMTRNLLVTLARAPRCTVGVVSGRPLRDLQQRVGAQGLLYIGNHGFEIQRGQNIFVHPAANAKAGLLRRLAGEMTRCLTGIKGAWVEDKGCTLSIHFRQTPASQVPMVKKVIYDIVRTRTVPGGLFLKNGKKVIEIRPERNWHKGSAVELLRRAEPGGTCVLYVGDDATDEDVFRILSRKDVSVRVGQNGPTKAQFIVRNPADVQKLLKKLIQLTQEKSRDE